MSENDSKNAKTLLDFSETVSGMSRESDCRFVARATMLIAKLCRVVAKRLDPEIFIPETYPWERSNV